MALKRVLLPVDGSPNSKKAVYYAAEYGKTLGWEVTLFHVTPSLDEFQRNRLDPFLRECRDILLKSECTANVKLSIGRAWSEIVKEADKGYDMIIMGSRGSGGLERMLLGSVAENVVRECKCSVTIVK